MGHAKSTQYKNLFVSAQGLRIGVFVVLVLLWRLLLHSVGEYSRFNYSEKLPRYSSFQFANVWSVWDSGFYFAIAKYGYPQNVFIDASSWQGRVLEFMGRPPESSDSFSRESILQYAVNKPLAQAWLETQDPQAKTLPKHPYWQKGWFSTYHFMPLYPYLSGLFSNIFSDVVVSGILISNISLLIGILVFYHLLRLDFSEEISRWVIFFYVFSPLTCLLGAFLTESLNNGLLFLALWSAKRSKVTLSALIAALICLTRLNGFLVFIPLMIIYYRQSATTRQFMLRALLSALPACVLLVLHLFWIYLLSDDFLAISRSNNAWGIALPSSLAAAISSAFSAGTLFVVDLPAWGITLALLICGCYWSRAAAQPRIPPEYVWYGLALFLLYSFSGTLQSSTRYMVTNPILYICVGLIAVKCRAPRMLLAASAILALIVMFFWTRHLPQFI